MAKLSMLHSSRFRRYPDEGYIGGVCMGLAVFLDWNVRLIRAVAVLTLFFSGFFPLGLIYAVLWYVMEDSRGPRTPRGSRYDGNDRGPGGSGSDAASGGYSSSRSSTDSGRYGGHRDYGAAAGYGMSSTDLRQRFSRLDARLASMEECVTSNDYELRRELRKLEH